MQSAPQYEMHRIARVRDRLLHTVCVCTRVCEPEVHVAVTNAITTTTYTTHTAKRPYLTHCEPRKSSAAGAASAHSYKNTLCSAPFGVPQAHQHHRQCQCAMLQSIPFITGLVCCTIRIELLLRPAVARCQPLEDDRCNAALLL